MANNQNLQSLGLLDHVKGNSNAMSYYRQMAKDNRIITIYNGNEIIAFMAFSITNDHIPFARKDTWDYLPHNPSGHVCFVEKIAAKVWDKFLRDKIEDIIVSRYPSAIYGMWYRPRTKNGKDWNQKIIIKRRNYVRDKVSIE